MKKNIEIPKVEEVYIAAVLEENKDFATRDWNAYIINAKQVPLEMILIVSRGYDNTRSTAVMRHKIQVLPAKSYAKIEFLQDEILELNNEFLVSFFENNKIYEKTYTLEKHAVKESDITELPVMNVKGILLK